MTIGTISIIVCVVILILLKLFFKEKKGSDHKSGFHGVDHNKLFAEDLDFDPSWSILSSNTHHFDED